MIPPQTAVQMGKSSLKEKTNMMKALPMMSLLGGGGMGQNFMGAGGGAGASAAPSFSAPSNPGPGFSTPPGGSLTPPGSFDPGLQPWEPPTTPIGDLGSGGFGGGPSQGFTPPMPDVPNLPVTDFTSPTLVDSFLGNNSGLGGAVSMPDTSWLNLIDPEQLADVANVAAN